MIKTVVKRNGSIEKFDPERLLKWAEWAGELGADWSGVLREAFRKCSDGCKTSELHNAMISACLDKKDPAHERMAGRLYIGSVYKECYGDYETIPTLSEMYKDMVELGYWRDMGYSEEELAEYDSFIDHDLDLSMTYSQLKQIVGKYSCQDRVKNKLYETPQFTYMRMALGLSYDKPEEERKKDVYKYYEKFSVIGSINCPTPNITNLGTWNLGLASCCLYVVEDTAESLAVGDHIAYMMTCNSAGIGNNILTRSIDDPVRGGMIKHNGKLPYYKAAEASVKANLQGSRGGSLTTHFCALDPEAKTLIKLRNPTTVASKRIGGIDYSFGSHAALDRRIANNLSWMLISLKTAPDLWKLYYSDKLEEFEKCYEKYEKDSSVKKEIVNAREYFLPTLQEAQETGRFYDHDLYEINRHTPFKETIYSSNLCQEVVQVTKPFKNMQDLYSRDSEGEISTCNLAAIVAGRVETDQEYEESCYYALKMIDDVIEIGKYPFPSLDRSAKARRNAGVGITNLAYDLASKGLNYTSKDSKAYIHRLAERHSYFLHKASIRLAKERGACEWLHKTKYPDGWLPIDTYKKNVDKITDQGLVYDWEALRSEGLKYGYRFSILEAFMPVESSSIASYSTNGLYPIRGLVVEKKDGNKVTTFIAPDADILVNRYQIAWDIPTKDIIEMYALFQKFSGGTISADYYIKDKEMEGKNGRKFSADELLTDYLYAKHVGVKTRYYTNTENNADMESACVGGACTL